MFAPIQVSENSSVRGQASTGKESEIMRPNLSLNPDASPAALARRPLGAG